MSYKEDYLKMRSEINKVLESIKKENPAIAEYLSENIIYDDKKMTVKYTGDSRITINKIFP